MVALDHPVDPITHEDVLTLARKVAGAAHDEDHDRLEVAVPRLFEALLHHVGDELRDLVALEPAERRRMLRGQQRILDRLMDLALASGQDCESIAQLLLAELTVQADAERRSFTSITHPVDVVNGTR